jgi:hypothetical protein
MRADNIAALGRVGKIAAQAIASSGRVGRNILLLIIPVDYTPFTLVSVEPHFFEQDILAKEFFVEIVENEEKEVEVVAGYVYVLATEQRFELDILSHEGFVTVLEVLKYEVEPLQTPFEVEVIDGGLYN